MSADPIGLRGGINLYGYVGWNPVGWFDVNGLDKLTLTYDLQSREMVSGLEASRMPSDTIWESSSDGFIDNLRKQIGEYDPNGTCGNCIKLLTLSGHSGIPGLFKLGEDAQLNVNNIPGVLARSKAGLYFPAVDNGHKIIQEVSKYFCSDGGVIDFASCKNAHPDLQKYLDDIFPDNVQVKLHETGVEWIHGEPHDGTASGLFGHLVYNDLKTLTGQKYW